MSKKSFKRYTCKLVQSGNVIEVYCYDNVKFKRLENDENSTKKNFKSKKNPKHIKEEKPREERTVNRTKRELRRLINSNIEQYKQKDKFITLTFKDEPTRDEVFYKFKQFNRRLKRFTDADYQYVAVIERGTKNTQRLHLHCLFFGLPYIKQSIFQEIWKYGIVDMRRVKDYDDIAGYVVKYISKTLSDETYIPRGKKAYTTSHGLRKPCEMLMTDDELINYISDIKKLKLVYENKYENEWIGSFNYFKYKVT